MDRNKVERTFNVRPTGSDAGLSTKVWEVTKRKSFCLVEAVSSKETEKQSSCHLSS